MAEHTDGRTHRIPLAPDRPVADVTGELLAAVGDLVGPVRIDTTPQETPWTVPLDEDYEHRTYDPAQVSAYFTAATQAALVLAALRAPYRGRSTPVNAWWGTFDLAVSLFSGRPVDPPSNDFIMRNSANAEQVEVGWWPGDARYPHAAFFAFAFPPPDGYETATLSPPAARWHPDLREFILNWDDVRAAPDPTEPRSTSAVRLSGTRAPSAAGTLTLPPAPKASRHRSSDRRQHLDGGQRSVHRHLVSASHRRSSPGSTALGGCRSRYDKPSCGMLARHRSPLRDVRNLGGDADAPDVRAPSAGRA